MSELYFSSQLIYYYSYLSLLFYYDLPKAPVHRRSLGLFKLHLHDGVVFRLLLRADLCALGDPLQVSVDHEGEVRQGVDNAEGRDDEYVVLCDSDVWCSESRIVSIHIFSHFRGKHVTELPMLLEL